MLDLRLRKDRQAALKGLAGTSILFCHISGKFYVGSSCNIANRMDCYIPSDANYKAKLNSLILKALFKYGPSSFTLLVPPIPNPTRETLLKVGPDCCSIVCSCRSKATELHSVIWVRLLATLRN
jgi:hypothetical protein